MANNLGFITEMDVLHSRIIDDTITIELVRELAKKYKGIPYFTAQNKNSAAFTALQFGRIDTYEILINHGFRLYPHENIKNILGELSSKRRITDDDEIQRIRIFLRGFRKSCFRNLWTQHLNILSGKSKVKWEYLDRHERQRYREIIDNAYEELNEIEEIAPLMKIAANSEPLRIVFDFEKASVTHMDPDANESTGGLTYPSEHIIYIGAKDFLQESTKDKVLGTISHELCHYAMQLVYGNDCKPYANIRSSKEEKFQDIEKYCRTIFETNDVISLVYKCYPKDRYHAELIVRVPQLIALYRRDPCKREMVQTQFIELFNFYYSTLVDIQIKLDKNEALAEAKSLKEVCNVLTCAENPETYKTPEHFDAAMSYLSNIDSRLLYFHTDCTDLTLISIYKKLKLENKLYSFAKFEHFKKYLSNDRERIIVVDCDGIEIRHIEAMTDELLKLNIRNRVIFVTNQSTGIAENFRVYHSWNPNPF